MLDVRCFHSNTKEKEERWEGKQDEKAACLSIDLDEEERSAQISSAHSQGGRCRAIQEGGVVVDAGGVCFPLAEEEAG